MYTCYNLIYEPPGGSTTVTRLLECCIVSMLYNVIVGVYDVCMYIHIHIYIYMYYNIERDIHVYILVFVGVASGRSRSRSRSAAPAAPPCRGTFEATTAQ